MFKSVTRPLFVLLATTGLTAPLAAESTEAIANTANYQTAQGGTFDSANPLATFKPAVDSREHRIDYAYWDEALGWFVIPMGPSIREGAPSVDPGLGTRVTFGHTSRFRLEGNRVAFSYLTDDIRASLTEYRQDLERIGTELDLARLPRNEQLAFWLNLHNVAVIEALAKEYPLSTPASKKFGSNQAGLQDAKLVTVKGVALSPRDIREGIVFANWKDPKVIYGFWHGEIGGPSIQRLAFTGTNVDQLLALSAEEFVNSLRGVESLGGSLRVSRIYEEAAPFYFANFDTLRAHLARFAGEDVQGLLNKTSRTSYAHYEGDIADLTRGESDIGLNFVCTSNGLGYNDGLGAGNCSEETSSIDRSILRLMQERDLKLAKAYRRGIRTGTVIVGSYDPDAPPKEVE